MLRAVTDVNVSNRQAILIGRISLEAWPNSVSPEYDGSYVQTVAELSHSGGDRFWLGWWAFQDFRAWTATLRVWKGSTRYFSRQIMYAMGQPIVASTRQSQRIGYLFPAKRQKTILDQQPFPITDHE